MQNLIKIANYLRAIWNLPIDPNILKNMFQVLNQFFNL